MSAKAFHVLTKPIGSICNLDCKYCFYLEKEVLYPDTSKWTMADDVIDSYICQYIEQQDTDIIHFAWQGGEPTLLGVDYFRKVITLQSRYANGKSQQIQFGQNANDTLPQSFQQCEIRFDCNGECPKHRFLKKPDGEAGLNYLCAGSKQFFNHIDPYMRFMIEQLRQQSAPANVMQWTLTRDA